MTVAVIGCALLEPGAARSEQTENVVRRLSRVPPGHRDARPLDFPGSTAEARHPCRQMLET